MKTSLSRHLPLGHVVELSQIATWVKRWRWVLALNAFLLAPIALYELRIGAGGPDKTLLFILPASLLWLAVVQVLIRRALWAHLALLPFYLSVAADLYVISGYKTRLGSSMLLVVVDNWGDAAEYAQAHASRLGAAVAALVFGYAYALRRIRDLRVTLPRWTLFALGALLLLLYGGVQWQVGTPVHLAAHDRNSPFGVLPQAYVAYAVRHEAKKDAEQARHFRFHTWREKVPEVPETIVLVVGETARPDHFSLYGYHRDTTPRLRALPNLIGFRDVVSQSALTKVSVPLILTRGSIDNQARTAREASVVSAFREVGFSTYWFSTQQRDPFTGTINRYSSEAETQRFFERRHDGVMLEPIAEALQNAGTSKVFMVVHVMGNHFVYESRYPEEFQKFPVSEARSERERVVNAYDNTVVYADHVLAELIARLNERPGVKALLYVADHGENLLDDERELFGHFLNNEYDLPVPMFFWYSDEFAQRYPDKVRAARANASQPLTTRSVFYSLLQAADVRLDDAELAKVGVFSPELQRYPRLVSSEHKPVDYDQMPKPGLDRLSRRSNTAGL